MTTGAPAGKVTFSFQGLKCTKLATPATKFSDCKTDLLTVCSKVATLKCVDDKYIGESQHLLEGVSIFLITIIDSCRK